MILAACSGGADAVRCELSEEVEVGASDTAFDAVALARDAESLVAFWSTSRGLFARRLGDDGAARGPEVRIGPRCEGGVAAASGDRIGLACSTRGRAESDRRGGALVLSLDRELSVRERRIGGEVGERSQGIAIALRGERADVAFHDSGRSGARAWFWPAGEEPHLASRSETMAGAPSLAMIEDGPALLWAEMAIGDDGTEVGEVRLERASVAPRRIATVVYGDSRPVLGRIGDRFVVAFRDERPAGSRTRLYVQALDDRWDPTGVAVEIGRADGAGGPRLVPCDGALYAIAPRGYGSEDLVAVHRLNPELRSVCGEKQLYDVGRQFALAEAVCTSANGGEDLVVLTAERGTSDSPSVRLLTMIVHAEGARD
jgi:hypothetical protein